MKKIISLLTITAMIAFLGCSQMGGGGGNSPEAVAKNFIVAMGKGDIDKAAKYGTKNTKKFLEMSMKMAKSFEDLAEDLAKENQKKGKPIYKDFKVKSMQDDKAIVTYMFSTSTTSPVEQEVHLAKENGKWLVDFTMGEDMDWDRMEEGMKDFEKEMNNMGEEMEDEGEEMEEMGEDMGEGMKKMGKDFEKMGEDMQELGKDMEKMMEDAAKALEDMDK